MIGFCGWLQWLQHSTINAHPHPPRKPNPQRPSTRVRTWVMGRTAAGTAGAAGWPSSLHPAVRTAPSHHPWHRWHVDPLRACVVMGGGAIACWRAVCNTLWMEHAHTCNQPHKPKPQTASTDHQPPAHPAVWRYPPFQRQRLCWC